MMEEPPTDLRPLSRRISLLLEIGLGLSAVCLLAGLGYFLLSSSAVDPTTTLGLGRHALAIWSTPGGYLLTLGLALLIAMPVSRVVLSSVTYARMRDWDFVALTCLVLVVLGVTFVLSLWVF